MNKRTFKLGVAALLAVLLVSAPIFARDKRMHNRPRFDEMHFEDGKRNRLALTQSQMALLGDWSYFGNNYLVKIDFDRDGDMEISVREGNMTETEWEGFWTADDNKITFNVVKKEVEDYSSGTKRKITERLSETWTIDYSLDANGVLLLTCSNLPSQVANNTAYQHSW